MLQSFSRGLAMLADMLSRMARAAKRDRDRGWSNIPSDGIIRLDKVACSSIR
jgi:hypothetical protein